MLKNTLLSILLLLSFNSKADLDIDLLNKGTSSKNSALLRVYGEIKKNDVNSLNLFLKNYSPEEINLIVGLDSYGGDLTSAMEIGRILRTYNATSVMIEEEVCHSACVFIIAGTPKRAIGGKVGIHRPYLSQDNKTTTGGQKKQKEKIAKPIIQFLNEMNVSESLFHDMSRISPANIKILSQDDLLKYGLGSTDQFYEDAENAKLANQLGISSSDLVTRKAIYKSACQSAPEKEFFKCYSEIVEKGNLDYRLDANQPNIASSENKEQMILTLNKLRPNWKDIVQSSNFKDWLKNLNETDRVKLNDSWDPYYVNDKIQEFLEQDSNKPLVGIIKLACQVGNSELILEVDTENSTVNGTKARINQNFIQYEPKGLNININRASGLIKVEYVPAYSKKGVPLLPDSGKCNKIEKNRF